MPHKPTTHPPMVITPIVTPIPASGGTLDPELIRRFRRLEHCCDKIAKLIEMLHEMEIDIHNRARNIEVRVTRIEVQLKHIAAEHDPVD